MITESRYWKDPLAKDADIIERWAEKTSRTERRHALLERKIMLSAFAMRKLIDSNKLSSAFSSKRIDVASYPAKSDRITFVDVPDLSSLYDFENETAAEHEVRRLLNQIIHSLVFDMAYEDDGRASGFYVSSDFDRHRALLLVPLASIVELLRQAAMDYPSHVQMVFDTGKNDWEIWTGDGEPPQSVKDKFERIRAAKTRP